MENKPKISILKIFFIVLLILIVLLSGGLNYYFYTVYIKNSGSNNQNNNDYISGMVQDNTITTDEFNSNTTVDIDNTTKPLNIASNSTIVDLTVDDKESDKDENVDLDELKTLIEQYAVGIQRIEYTYENLESNTILLFIAKRYFDTNSSKSSLTLDAKYASTAENFHKYLSELTGKKYKNIEYIKSYTNYNGNSKTNKAYVLGKDSSIITNEDYVCTAIEVVDRQDDLYTARAIIRRTADNVKTVYQITFNFKINSDYEYQKYQIVSLNAINSSYYPDNTVHLIEG